MKRNAYLLLCGAFLVCVWQMSLPDLYGFSIFPDEFGYWAWSAQLLGYDWSEVLTLGQSYPAGYTLLLLPIYAVVRDPVLAYRAAVSVNFLLLFFCLLLVNRLLRGVFPEDDRRRTAILAGAAILYPAWLVYAQTTLAEVPILFCYLLLCRLLQRWYSGRKGIVLLPITLLSVYLLFLHRRLIGVFAAVVLCFLEDAVLRRRRTRSAVEDDRTVRRRRWGVLAALVLAIVLFGILIRALPLPEGDAVNTHSLVGQIEKLQHLFSLRGALDFVISVCGKLYYLTASTGGLFLWGIAEITTRARAGNGAGEEEAPLFRFLLLSAVLNFLVGAVFMVTDHRGDTIIYGRYNEMLIPLALALGLRRMMETDKKRFLRGNVCNALLLAAVTLVSYGGILSKPHVTKFEGLFVVGLSYWLHSAVTSTDMDIPQFYLQGGLYGLAAMAVLLFLVWMIRRRRGAWLLLLLLLLAQIGLGMRAADRYVHFYNVLNRAEQAIAGTIRADGKRDAQNEGRRVLYIDQGSHSFIGVVQFYLREIPIRVAHELDAAREEDVLLLFADDEWESTDILERYQHTERIGRYTVCYNTLDEGEGTP